MERDCLNEIIDLHKFLADWLNGTQPRTLEAYARRTDVLGADFAIINPSGAVTERAALIADLEAAHGGRAGRGFRIWIENSLARQMLGDFCLVTYEEWQEAAGDRSARLSSALFRRRRRLPNRVEWLHLHETWLPDQAPSA